MNDTYYIYRYVRLDKNVPFYIGMGTAKDKNKLGHNINSTHSRYRRAYSKDRNKTCLSIMDKAPYDIEIIYETTNKSHAEEKEKEFISLYGFIYDGSGTLVNLTKGGTSFKTTGEYLKNHHFACERTGNRFAGKSKSVCMYGLDGEYLEYFPTINGFCKKYKLGYSSPFKLSAAIKGKHSYRGYYFSFEKFDKLDISHFKTPSSIRHHIVQYKDGIILNVFKSLREAAKKTGVSIHKLSKMPANAIFLDGYEFKRTKLPELSKIQQCS